MKTDDDDDDDDDDDGLGQVDRHFLTDHFHTLT
jgi:hypothetical protein